MSGQDSTQKTVPPGLTPWKPGQSGNPKGRPPGTGYKQLSLAAFATLIEGDEGRATVEAFVKAYREKVEKAEGWQGQQFAERIFQQDVFDQLDEWTTRGQKRDLAFLRYMIALECFDEQREVLLTAKPFIINIGGRRGGKTQGWARLLVDRALTHTKGVALYLGRTAKSAFGMIWQPTVEILKTAGIENEVHISTQTIKLGTGAEIWVRGRNTKEDVENLRGNPYFLAIIDEIQSDIAEKLKYIIKDILEPAGKDFTDSQIAMGGTPPRIPGNYAEEMYLSNRQDIKRLSWNMSVNPHIPESERDLEKTRVAKGFKETDPTWQREYLGKVGSYDTEALVFKLGPANHFEEIDLRKWIDSQPITDVFLSGGLDYGFDDFDSAAVVLASESKGERFLLAEYKGNRQSTADFGNELKRLAALVDANPYLSQLPSRRFTWYCDTEGLGKQLTHDLASMYGLSVQPAYQGQPDLMVEMLQDDIRQGRFKVHAKQVVSGAEIVGPFEQESYKIVFERDPVTDALTRRIDEAVFHPEIAKSVLYAERYVWMKSRVKPGGSK